MYNLIFDFDGTIVDSKECSIVATQKSFKERGLEEPTVNLIEYYMGIPIEKLFVVSSKKTDVLIRNLEILDIDHLFTSNRVEQS